MARYRGPRGKLMRREGTDLLLMSNVRSADSKCKMDSTPGQHGKRKGRISDYALMLREKQKIRRIYGVLEKQFRRYYKEAARQKGATGENLLKLLESRLDNIVYRMGFASTRAEARQLVSHKGIEILPNKNKDESGDSEEGGSGGSQVVNIPSFMVPPESTIIVREKAQKQGRVQAALELSQQLGVAEWLEVDPGKYQGKFKWVPGLDDLPPDINVNLVVEFYSK